jgi:hypothetical protein
MATPLIIRKTAGRITRAMFPGYGTCRRCGASWAVVKHHSTPIDTKRGIFALCESCWTELEPEKRIPFYQKLVNDWVSIAIADNDIDEVERLLGLEWAAIKAAVLRGE